MLAFEFVSCNSYCLFFRSRFGSSYKYFDLGIGSTYRRLAQVSTLHRALGAVATSSLLQLQLETVPKLILTRELYSSGIILTRVHGVNTHDSWWCYWGGGGFWSQPQVLRCDSMELYTPPSMEYILKPLPWKPEL